MNARLSILILALGFSSWIMAQTTEGDPEKIGEEQAVAPDKPNEVTVVLPPTDETPPTGEDSSSEKTTSDETSSQPSESEKNEAQPADEEGKSEATADVSAPADDTPKEPEPGLAVRVERLQSGSTEIDPAKVKLLAPFPAKLLARSPEGWIIESSESAPPFTREVELSPGKRITLNVRPHLLLAQADGSNVFQIEEPGYDAALGYRQNATVAAILSTSIRQLDDDSRQLGTVIDQLQQLLVSLPQPTITSEPAQEAKPKANRKR